MMAPKFRLVGSACSLFFLAGLPSSLSLANNATVPAAGGNLPALDAFHANPSTRKLDIDLSVETRKDVVIGGYTVTTDVFIACQAAAKGKRCGGNYAGPRLLLNQGDDLIIHYRNNSESGDPINNHTHGLIVRANGPLDDDKLPDDPKDNSIGDNIFYNAAAPATGSPPEMPGHAMGSTGGNTLEYNIHIPAGAAGASHPSGIAWFHPHVHGLAKQQVSAGLSGMINIGSIWDYACLHPKPDGRCGDTPGNSAAHPALRHMMLKDIQLENLDEAKKTAAVLRDQDPAFCKGHTDDGLQGYCLRTGADGTSVTGKWMFSINGAVHPAWKIATGRAEVWRIQNASANVTYDLHLYAPNTAWGQKADSEGMPFQVLAVDGINLQGGGGPSDFTPPLQRRLLMMPGSRAEILVAYRDGKGCDPQAPATCPVVTPAVDQTVMLVNNTFRTGWFDTAVNKWTADIWPQLELANITFSGKPNLAGPSAGLLTLLPKAASDWSLFTVAAKLPPISRGPHNDGRIKDLCRSQSVYALAEGEMRRVYFGIIEEKNIPPSFLLGTTIVTQDGTELEETPAGLQPIEGGPLMRPFDMGDPAKSDLCVPFGETETWELVNVSAEVHNFHIHQNKFSIVPRDTSYQPRAHSKEDELWVPVRTVQNNNAISTEHDTVLVPRGTDTCTSDTTHFTAVADGAYRLTGTTCRGPAHDPQDSGSGSLRIQIPFVRNETIGHYVFHCHILEHEDLGMMSSIRVLSRDQMGLPPALPDVP